MDNINVNTIKPNGEKCWLKKKKTQNNMKQVLVFQHNRGNSCSLLTHRDATACKHEHTHIHTHSGHSLLHPLTLLLTEDTMT